MLQTISMPTMLMIGGSGRNVGKTTLICSIISKFSATIPIIGLKVTSIRPGEAGSHGYHETPVQENFKISEEFGLDNRKDTTRMLKAGAKKVYFIQSRDDQLPLAMESFFEIEDRNSIIICETRSLRNLIKPGIFILITDLSRGNPKTNFADFVKSADLLLEFDPLRCTLETNADKICLETGRWYLSDKK